MKIMKKLAIGGIALVIMVITLVIEQGVNPDVQMVQERKAMIVSVQGDVAYSFEGQTVPVTQVQELQAGSAVTTKGNSTAIINYSDNAVLRLYGDTVLEYKLMEEDNNGYFFELKEGQLWSNNVYSTVDLNILSGASLLIPRKAGLDLKYSDGKSVVRVFKNQVNIGLVEPGYAPADVIKYADGALINNFLVAYGGQATIFDEKVVTSRDILSKILYSKLVKEFQLVLFDKDEVFADSWIGQNEEADEQLLQGIAQVQLRKITTRNLKVASLDSLTFQFGRVFEKVANALTFSNEKIAIRTINNIFNHLKDAEYLYVFGRNQDAHERIKLFTETADEYLAKRNVLFEKLFIENLEKEYKDMIFVTPDDPLFAVKTTVADYLYRQLGDDEEDLYRKFLLVRENLNYVYEMAESNTLLARLSLEQYSQKLLDFINKERGRISEIRNLIAEENQIMDNLLRQYPQFYLDSVFAFKQTLEQEWLSLIPEGPDKDEEKQTIILAKIDFLKHLQNNFLAEKVVLAEAQKIAVRLINEISDLQPEKEVGISQLFALRLRDYGQFLKFLYTTEVSTMRGVSVKQRYDQYLAAQKEQISVMEAINEFLGQEVAYPTVTTDQILAQVRADFEKVEITDLDLGVLKSLDQKVVDVKRGVLQGITFSGLYNWDKKLISQVKVDGKTVSKEAIRLSSLESVVVPKEEAVIEKPETAAPPAEEVVEETQAEKVAKILLLQKLKKVAINADPNKMRVLDLNAQVYAVNDASLADKTKVIFSFRLQNKTDEVSELVLRTEYGDYSIDGLYKLSDLSKVAEGAYEQIKAQAAAEEE
jgi:hypothetical protein